MVADERARGETAGGVALPGREVGGRGEVVVGAAEGGQRGAQRRAVGSGVRLGQFEVGPQWRQDQLDELGVGQRVGRHQSEPAHDVEEFGVGEGVHGRGRVGWVVGRVVGRGARRVVGRGVGRGVGRVAGRVGGNRRGGVRGDEHAQRRGQPALLQAPRHLERDERADAVAEERERLVEVLDERVGQGVGEGGQVADRGFVEAAAAPRQVGREQLDVRATAVGYPDGRAHTQQLRPTAEGLRTASPVREADETPAGVGLGRQGDEPGGGRAPW